MSSRTIPSTTLLVSVQKWSKVNVQATECIRFDLTRAFDDADREAFVTWISEAAGKKGKEPKFKDEDFGEQEIKFRTPLPVCDVLDAICHFGGWTLVGAHAHSLSVYVFNRPPPTS